VPTVYRVDALQDDDPTRDAVNCDEVARDAEALHSDRDAARGAVMYRWVAPFENAPSRSLLGTSVDKLFSTVLRAPRAGRTKETRAPSGRPRSLNAHMPSVEGLLRLGSYEALRRRTSFSAAKPEAISPAPAAPAIGTAGGPPV